MAKFFALPFMVLCLNMHGMDTDQQNGTPPQLPLMPHLMPPQPEIDQRNRHTDSASPIRRQRQRPARQTGPLPAIVVQATPNTQKLLDDIAVLRNEKTQAITHVSSLWNSCYAITQQNSFLRQTIASLSQRVAPGEVSENIYPATSFILWQLQKNEELVAHVSQLSQQLQTRNQEIALACQAFSGLKQQIDTIQAERARFVEKERSLTQRIQARDQEIAVANDENASLKEKANKFCSERKNLAQKNRSWSVLYDNKHREIMALRTKLEEETRNLSEQLKVKQQENTAAHQENFILKLKIDTFPIEREKLAQNSLSLAQQLQAKDQEITTANQTISSLKEEMEKLPFTSKEHKLSEQLKIKQQENVAANETISLLKTELIKNDGTIAFAFQEIARLKAVILGKK